MDPDCWKQDPRTKMSEDLAFRVFSVDAIMTLFENKETWQLAVYFFLHFPLNLPLVKIETKGLHLCLILCMYAWIKIYCFVQNVG